MLSHDFIKRLARELVFNIGGHRVYGMAFSNWAMLMSLHKCAHTMCYGTLRLRCLVGATVRWWSRELGKRRRKDEVRGLLYVHVPGTFPKWTAVCSCLFYT